jgi:hypothetical protein
MIMTPFSGQNLPAEDHHNPSNDQSFAKLWSTCSTATPSIGKECGSLFITILQMINHVKNITTYVDSQDALQVLWSVYTLL